ncbi:hypothetical protein [Actinopolyspora mortivallis]|nr:hypothetical protein [Actinopolyspora mortivallis]
MLAPSVTVLFNISHLDTVVNALRAGGYEVHDPTSHYPDEEEQR